MSLLFSIDDTLQVKITDNALSRDLFPMDYHCLGDNENRPVRWMALESLVNNEFSSASDVVSARTPGWQQNGNEAFWFEILLLFFFFFSLNLVTFP